MKVKINKTNISWANKEGQPYLDKSQRPYARVGIQTVEYGTKWLSGFGYQGQPILSWKGGDEVEIEVKENGQYLNFSVPKAQGGVSGAWTPELIEKLFTGLATMKGQMSAIYDHVQRLEKTVPPLEVPPQEINPNDIPF